MATKSTENLDDNIEEICTATAKMEFSKVRVEMPDRVRNANFAGGMIKPDHDDSDNDDDHEADHDHVPPAERNVTPADVIEFTDEDEIIYVIGTWGGKVTRIAGLGKMKKIKLASQSEDFYSKDHSLADSSFLTLLNAPKDLILRSCLVGSMEGIENLLTLRKLELYDNQIEQISSLERLSNLLILDLSFNAIRKMVPNLAQCCPKLEELYIAQNKLRKIEGLEGLSKLRILDLGANRIRSMEGIETLSSLKALWLGKNKIEEIGGGIENLLNLRQLDIQNNRLRSIGTRLLSLSNMAELYLACNAIESVCGLPQSAGLNTVDLSNNPIFSLEGIQQYISIEELWMTKSAIDSFESLKPLSCLTSLVCVYLEHSPVAKDPEYRANLLSIVPTLQQLDAIILSDVKA